MRIPFNSILQCIIFKIIIMISITFPIFSNEETQLSVGVLLNSRKSAQSVLFPLELIINDTISLELKSEGYTVFTDSGTLETLFYRAKELRAAFVIESIYSKKEDKILVQLNCYRTADSEKIISIVKGFDIDLNLDTSICHELKEILSRIEEENVSPLAFSNPEHESKPLKIQMFASIGFSPYLATGESSDYFKTGLMPEIHGGIKISNYNGYLGLGIHSSLNYFKADGILVSSENMFISLGPELRLGRDVNPFWGVFLRISGGVSLFVMNNEDDNSNSTIVPYFSGGLGTSLQFSSFMGIVFSMNYTLYFEKSLLFTGFSPSLGLNFMF